MDRDCGFQYKILNINRDEHWISISSDNEFDFEEPDAFIYLLQRIRDNMSGKIEEIGDMRYLMQGDGLGLIYQWDSCFGISIIYPNEVTDKTVIDFLERYFGKIVGNFQFIKKQGVSQIC